MSLPLPSLVKRADWVRSYHFDFSRFEELNREIGDFLVDTPTVTSTPSGLTVGTPGISTNKRAVEVTLSGGTNGITYTLNISCGTDQGATLSGGVTVEVES